jgi:hypothetical protein
MNQAIRSDAQPFGCPSTEKTLSFCGDVVREPRLFPIGRRATFREYWETESMTARADARFRNDRCVAPRARGMRRAG